MRRKELRNSLGKFTPVGGVPLYSQFAEHLRGAIQGGLFAGGERFPSLRTISKQCGINYFSAQLATEELMREGLLYKVHGKGMFARDFTPRSGVVCVYAIGIEPPIHDSVFVHMAINYLCHKLNERGFEAMVHFDHRKPKDCGVIPAYLDRMIKGNRLTALLAVTLRSEDRGWFERLTIPRHVPGPWNQNLEESRKYYAPLKELLDSGKFRRPLFMISGGASQPFEKNSHVLAMIDSGIDLRSKRGHRFYVRIPNENYAEHAYRLLRGELSQKERPDLLYVFPDEAMPGVIFALRESGVRVPEELQLVSHRNKEIPLFCPYPAVFLDVSVEEYAEELLEALCDPLQRRQP